MKSMFRCGIIASPTLLDLGWMRKAVIVGVMLVTGSVSAQIWSESFSTISPPTLHDTTVEGVGGIYGDITNEFSHGEWVHVGATLVTNDGGALRLQVNQWSGDGHGGRTWGAGIALDSSVFTAGAATYRLKLDISATQADARLGVRVWDASIGSGGASSYYQVATQDYGAPGSYLKVVPVGDASTNLLAEAEFNSGHSGVRSVDFAYDGTGDVVLQLMALSSSTSVMRWSIINEVSLDVAALNPDVPSFASDNYTIIPDALENAPYTNSTLLAAITSNPGVEPIAYAAGKVAWMSISEDGVISGTPMVGGTNTIYISVADTDGASDWATFSLFVNNVNDVPVLNALSNKIWAIDALAGIPYVVDLSGYASDEEGDLLTFSILSGPAWLDMSTNGVVSGAPGDGDYGSNEWQFMVDDGSASVTGTLHVAVQKKTIVHYENFNTMASVPTANPAIFPDPRLVTTTPTNGFWYKGGTVKLTDGDGTLEFERVANTGGLSATAIVFAEVLFADGAGTYTLSFDIVNAGQANKTYVELHDLDLSSGTVSVPTYKWAKLFEDPDGTLPDVTVDGGAVATLVTNVTYDVGSTGIKTIEFEYDGSGDVLLRIGAGKNNATDWWTNHKIDDLMILGASMATAYDLWAERYGLSGVDADLENDVEPDGVINLLEYAFNGDPTNVASHGTFPAMGTTMFDGSTNWVQFIHVERTDDDAISYTIEKRLDLVFDTWTNSTDAIVVGESPAVDSYKTVTNAVPTDGKSVEFLRVKVQK